MSVRSRIRKQINRPLVIQVSTSHLQATHHIGLSPLRIKSNVQDKCLLTWENQQIRWAHVDRQRGSDATDLKGVLLESLDDDAIGQL
jgi:hypothetical protein